MTEKAENKLTEENNKFQILNKTVLKDGTEKVTVSKACLKKYLSQLKNSAEYYSNILLSVTGYDNSENIELIYTLFSTKFGKIHCVSVILDRNNPVCDSISDIFRAADFEEREIYDLLGVYFEGNKDLKRILMPSSMVGTPLRKDYNPKDERLAWNENL